MRPREPELVWGENPLLTKLKRVAILSDSDRAALGRAFGHVRSVAENQDVIAEGKSLDHVHLILKGWAARYKMLPDGARQITALLIPGDLCDLDATISGGIDHAIAALTPTKVAMMSHLQFDELVKARPVLAQALWGTTLVDEAILRAWIVNLGRRDARERLAHLFCELHLRMRQVEREEEDRFEFPLTQIEIADALALTPVHTNRMIQLLRKMGLIELHKQALTILNLDGLRTIAGFDPSYLQRALAFQNNHPS